VHARMTHIRLAAVDADAPMVPRLLPVAIALALVLSGCTADAEGEPPGAAIASEPEAHVDGSLVPAAPDRIVVEVTGDAYRWHLRYPGADGVLGNQDDVVAMRNIRLPTHTPTILQLRSRDFVYKLRLPHLDLVEIAVPEQEFALEFDSGPAGGHELRGDQFCGFSHPDLLGTLHVDAPGKFMRWMSGLEPVHQEATEKANHR